MQTLEVYQMLLLALAFILLVILSLPKLQRKRPVQILKKLQRSGNYRDQYFKAHKGLFGKGIYICPFCGKLMTDKAKIQIDHIDAVRRVQKSKSLAKKYQSLPGGVNNIKNLTHTCPRCNKRKGSKGEIWVFLGHFGQYFMLLVRWLFFGLILYVLFTIVFSVGWKL